MGGPAGPEAVVQGKEPRTEGCLTAQAPRARRLLVLRAGAASSAPTPAFPSEGAGAGGLTDACGSDF